MYMIKPIASISILLLLMTSSLCVFAQNSSNLFGDFLYFDIEATYVPTGVTQSEWSDVPDTAVYIVLDFLEGKRGQPYLHSNRKPKTPILLGLKLPSGTPYDFGKTVYSFSKFYSSFLVDNNAKAEIIALGIDETNIKDYEYHVIESDSTEIIPWSPVPSLDKKYGAKKSYGFIGSFLSPGKLLFVEIKNKKNYNIRDGIILDWTKNYAPQLQQITVANGERYFGISGKDNRGYAKNIDPKSGVPREFRLPADSISRMDIKLKNSMTIKYDVLLVKEIGGKKDTAVAKYATNNSDNSLFFELNGDQFSKAGKYEIIIQPIKSGVKNWPESQKIRIPFEVIPPPTLDKKISLRTILPYSLATLLGVALLFWLYYYNNIKRLATSTREKENISFRLKAIRSQLNPHFIFNALSSIQGLINKNEVVSANHYLSKFAGLTRNVLQNSEEEVISLADEIQLLNDYLYMEQLRFGFTYTVEAETNIDVNNIEIPVMLLQPIVENAVKHGVSLLQQNGLIQVNVYQEKNNLLLTIKDNGSGFDPDAQSRGFGIKLTKERIELLNKMYKSQMLDLNIISGETGTIVTISLHHWL